MKFVPIIVLLLSNVAAGADFYQDFRGKPLDKQAFSLIGTKADEWIKFDMEGVRITLPADQEFKSSVGLATTFPIKGDFDIITSYELLQADKPATGNGVGFEFYVRTDTPTDEVVRFARVARVKEGDVYMCSRYTTDDEGKRQPKHHYIPAKSKGGQLRLTRKGKEVTFWVAEEPEATFRELYHYELGDEDVTTVWVAAYTGKTKNAVDLRIKDFRVRAPETPQPDTVPVATAPPGSRMVWLLSGLGGLGLIVLGAWAWRRQRHGVSQYKAPANPQRLSVRCAACAHGFKVQAELAGKKVKCPECGKALLIPEAKPENAPNQRSV